MALDPALRPFFLPPDWSQPVMERLQFRTDAIVSEDYTTQTRATRVTPRRSFEFQIGANNLLRQRFANATYLNGGRQWYLPIWVDGAELQAPAGQGADTVLASAVGLPFTPGDPVFIQSPDQLSFEMAEVAEVYPASMVFTGALANSYPAGSRVFSALRAQIDQEISQNAFTSGFAYGRVKLNVMEPNPFAAHTWESTYRGFPVLIDRPVTNRDPATAYQWMLEDVDDDLGIPTYADPVGIPLYRQTHDWVVTSRTEISRLRGIAYALEGKQKSLWVPTWSTDLELHAQLNAGQTGLQVKRCGASALATTTNRRDLRIETTSGVYYRRIQAGSDTGAGVHETLTLDSSLPIALNASTLVQISYMALSRSETDNFEFNYFTGEVATVAMAWRARQHDV